MSRPLLCLLLLAFVVPAVHGAGLALESPWQEYYFPAGSTVEIPLTAENTFPGELEGTLSFATDTQLQKPGTIMISTQDRVSARTIPPGRSFLNLTIPSSAVPREYKVRVSFYYKTPGSVNVTLPGILVHIVSGPGVPANVPGPVTSTSRPESGTIPSSSTVSVAEQTVSTREQMGSDSTNGVSASPGLPQAQTEDQRQQNLREKEKQVQEQAKFNARLATDPLFLRVNASLGTDGFTLSSHDTQASSGTTGTFTLLYRRGADDLVVVRGAMVDGGIPFLAATASAPVTADPAFNASARFQSLRQELADKGYHVRSTDLNWTPTGTAESIAAIGTSGRTAFLNATADGGRVTMVSLNEEAEGLNLAMIAGILALIAAGGALMYRRYTMSRDNGAVSPGPVRALDPRAASEAILVTASEAYDRGNYPEAYGLAARALRVYVSHEYGENREATTEEIRALLGASGESSAGIMAVLERCRDVTFARGRPDAGEFMALVETIRSFFKG